MTITKLITTPILYVFGGIGVILMTWIFVFLGYIIFALIFGLLLLYSIEAPKNIDQSFAVLFGLATFVFGIIAVTEGLFYYTSDDTYVRPMYRLFHQLAFMPVAIMLFALYYKPNGVLITAAAMCFITIIVHIVKHARKDS